jgi:hypothetical protein
MNEPAPRPRTNLRQLRDWESGNQRKLQQSAKIRELGEALAASNVRTLDHKAEVLGLSRSTTWALLQGNHKSSGLSVTVINRILAAPELPPQVRTKVIEYIEEKAAGRYGHSKSVLRRFVNRLSAKHIDRTYFERILESQSEIMNAKVAAAWD